MSLPRPVPSTPQAGTRGLNPRIEQLEVATKATASSSNFTVLEGRVERKRDTVELLVGCGDAPGARGSSAC